jgi:hypothetical protein
LLTGVDDLGHDLGGVRGHGLGDVDEETIYWRTRQFKD